VKVTASLVSFSVQLPCVNRGATDFFFWVNFISCFFAESNFFSCESFLVEFVGSFIYKVISSALTSSFPVCNSDLLQLSHCCS